MTAIRRPIRLALVAATAALLLALAPVAFAAKGGGGGGGKGGSATASGSLSLVLINSSDGLPHWGQTVTFDVTTTVSQPYVTLNCFQNGAQVYTMTAGFYASYPFTHYYTLSSSSWTSGAADCTADLHYSTSSGKRVTLATLSFPVYP